TGPSCLTGARDGEAFTLSRRRRGTRRRIALARFTRWIDEEPEELGIRFQQHARVIGAQTGLVGLHRAIEREEIRIAAVSLGEDAVALRVALAAGALALRLRLREQHGHIAIGLGADLLRLLRAFRTILRGLLLSLGLHALVDGLAVLLRQVGAANAHVDHGNAIALRLGVELLAHPRHQML